MDDEPTPGPAASPLSDPLERALRWAADHHRGQLRKGSSLPYVQHPMAVAMVLQRLGWPEPVVVAALLHDLVEDTDATLDQLREAFGEEVAGWVGACTERKRDEDGRPRPWEHRKAELLGVLADAPAEARAVALADAWHNLFSIAYDLRSGEPVWSRFNADRDRQLAIFREKFDRLGVGDPRLEALADDGRALLERVAAIDPGVSGNSAGTGH